MFKKIASILFLFISSQIAGQQDRQIDSLKGVLKKTNIDSVKCNVLLSLGEVYASFNLDSGILFVKQAEKIATANVSNASSPILKNRFIYFNAYALYCLGILEMSRNNLEKGKEYFEVSKKKYELINDKEGIGNCFHDIGYIYFLKGDITNTLNYYNLALKLYKEINFKTGLAASYINTAAIYKEQGDLKNALKNYQEALIVHRELKDNNGVALGLINMGNIYTNGDPFCSSNLNECLKTSREKALKYLLESVDILNKQGDKKNIAAAYNNIGVLYSKQNNFDNAEKYFNLSLQISSEINSKNQMAYSSMNLADIAIQKNQLDKAQEYAAKSLQWAKEIGYIEVIKLTYLTLKKLHLKQGNYKEALAMNELWLLMKDSVTNEANKKDNLRKNMQLTFENKTFADSLKAAKEKEIVTVQLASQKTQRNYLYVIIVLAVFFGAFVFYRLRLSDKQKKIIERQKHLIEEHQKETIDSITYAKRIQDAILPPIDLIQKKVENFFVLFKPKDIVAGDFYWIEQINDTVLIAVADCTGHGVPGAMVSVVCSNALNRAVKEFKLSDTGTVLDKVTDLVLETFEKSSTEVKDGMDISLLSINKTTKQVQWSGANNSLWYFENSELKEIKANKQPIGKSDHRKPFTTHTIDYKENTTFYLFTDGYADQFGGPNGKKFKYKQFQEVLSANLNKSLALQQTILNDVFEAWKSDLEQVDDVCIIGVRL